MGNEAIDLIESSGIHLMRRNLEEVYAKVIDPVHVDEFDIGTEEGKEDFNSYLYKKYDGDSLSTVPKCSCKVNPMSGNRNLGKICPTCGKPVVAGVESDINNQVWLRANERMYTYIAPRWMFYLDNKFTKDKVSTLVWFMSPRYRISSDQSHITDKLKAIRDRLGIERGWKSACDNLVPILRELARDQKLTKLKSSTEIRQCLEYVEANLDNIFTKYIPLPSNVTSIFETTSTGTYGDTSISNMINGARMIAELYSDGEVLDDDRHDDRMAVGMRTMAVGYTSYNKEEFDKKQSMIRSAAMSGRIDMSARAVITSLTRPHDHRELEIPWAMGLKLFEKKLCNWLYEEKQWGVYDSLLYIRERLFTYDELLNRGLQYLVNQGPELVKSRAKLHGWPVTFHRNPGLKLGSQYRLFITVVKTDPKDWTFSMSGMILGPPNAD